MLKSLMQGGKCATRNGVHSAHEQRAQKLNTHKETIKQYRLGSCETGAADTWKNMNAVMHRPVTGTEAGKCDSWLVQVENLT